MSSNNSKRVYSTHPKDAQEQEKKDKRAPVNPKSVTAYIERDRKGRAGKTVTVVTGIPGNLKGLKKELQKECGAGGSTKAGAIEIQGDHRDKVAAFLKAKGFAVKYKGG